MPEDIQPKVQYERKNNIFGKIHIRSDVVLSNRKIGDSCFLTKSNEIVKMKYAIKNGNEYYVCGVTIRASYVI